MSVLNHSAATYPKGYFVLTSISMLYMSIMLCNAILTNRYIGSDEFFILGGTLTSPFIFILDDIVAEIYGYKITRFMIVTGFISQTVFSLICELIVLSPYPTFLKYHEAYVYILGPSLLRIDLSGFFAYIIANLMNTYILTRWKILLKGEKFWLRSLGSSAVSEALYSFIAIILMEIRSIPIDYIVKVIFLSYLIKVLYSAIFAWPANTLVNYLKKITGIDVYDFSEQFTPFNYKQDYQEPNL